MHKRFSCKSSKVTAVLTVAVSAMVTLPVLLLPVGMQNGAPAYVIVNRAYAAAYPDDPTKQTVLVEKWAISGSNSVMGLEKGNSQETSAAAAGAETAPGVSVTGPAYRVGPEQLAAWAPHVRRAAEAIAGELSARLGPQR